MEFKSGVSFAVLVDSLASDLDRSPAILTMSMLGIPYMTDQSSNFSSTHDMIASSCELRFCAQTFAEHTSMSATFERESPRRPTVEPQHFKWHKREAVGTFKLDSAPAEPVSFDQAARFTLQNSLLAQLNGTHRIVQSIRGPWYSEDEGGDFIKNIWKSAMDPDVFIDNLAGSITDYLRTANASHDDSLNGVAYEFGVTVR
jgi:hypothetical protein